MVILQIFLCSVHIYILSDLFYIFSCAFDFQSCIYEIPYNREKQDERKAIVKECRTNFSESDLFNLHRHPMVDEWRVHDMWLVAGVLPTPPNYMVPSETINSFEYHFYIRGAFMDQMFEIGNREDLLKLKDVLLTAVAAEFSARKKIFVSVGYKYYYKNM